MRKILLALALVAASAGAASAGTASLAVVSPGTARVRTISQPLSTYLVEPCRFLDTRDATTFWYEPEGPFTEDQFRYYLVQESCGVPLGARGVILNVTVTGATAPGHIVLWEAETSAIPHISGINFAPGQTAANSITVRLSAVPPGGECADLRTYTYAPGGQVDVVIDVVGYLR